jgi:hypothetical protein
MNECPQIERTTGSNGSITPIEAEAPAGGSLGHSRRSHFDGGCAPWRRHSVESLELRLSATTSRSASSSKAVAHL